MIQKLKILFISFGLVLAISSCVTSKQTNLLQDIPRDYMPASKGEYKIIPGDKLAITIFTIDDKAKALYKDYLPEIRSANNSNQTTASNTAISAEKLSNVKPIDVYADGTIKFPYIGKLYTEGYTLNEIKESLNLKLKEIDEHTYAEVALYNRYFSIIGDSGASRIDMPDSQITIFQALALSPSLSKTANLSKVSVIRQTSDGTTLKTFDLRSSDIVDSDFYQIQANDVIYFPQDKRKSFGAPTTFLELFTILTSITGVIVFAFRII